MYKEVYQCIVHTDMDGMTKSMSEGSYSFIDKVLLVRSIVVEQLQEFGKLVHHIGDSDLLTFPDLKSAISFIQEVYHRTPEPLNIGVSCGNVVVIPGDIFGNAVNISSKLGEDTAKHGQILFDALICPDNLIKIGSYCDMTLELFK